MTSAAGGSPEQRARSEHMSLQQACRLGDKIIILLGAKESFQVLEGYRDLQFFTRSRLRAK